MAKAHENHDDKHETLISAVAPPSNRHPSSLVWPYQCEPRCRIADFLQVGGRFVDDDFKGGPDVSLLQVTGKRGPVSFPKDDVDVEHRLSRRRERHVADHGGNLDLLVHGIADVVLLLPIEIAEHNVSERTDACQLSRRYLVGANELLQACQRLVAGLQDDRKNSLPVLVVQELMAHACGPAS